MSGIMVFVLVLLTFGCMELRFSLREHQAEKHNPSTNPAYYYYNCLTYKEQLLFDVLASSAEQFRMSSDSLPYRFTEEEFTRVVTALRADAPQLFYVDFAAVTLKNAYHSAYLELSYRIDASELDDKKAALAQAVAAVLEDAPSENAGNQLPLYLHDALTDLCSHASETDSPFKKTAYGALVEGTADSEGYAQAYLLLLKTSGVQVLTVYGTADGQSHAWNMVAEDGAFAHVDVSWDDADLDFAPDMHFHGYYRLSDADISQTHTANWSESLPRAEEKETENYYQMYDLCASDEASLEEILYRELFSAGFAQRPYVELYLDMELGPQDDLLKPYRETILGVLSRINELQEDFELLPVYRAYPVSGDAHAMTIQIFYQDKGV